MPTYIERLMNSPQGGLPRLNTPGTHDADLLAAAPDAIALATGCNPRAAHPLAEQIARDGALSILALKIGQQQRGADASRPREVMAIGLRTTDFGNALAEGLAPAIARRFNAAAAHRRFCSVLDVKDYKPAQLPALAEVDLVLAEAGEAAEIEILRASLTPGAMTQIRRYSTMIGFSRELIVNDQAGAVAALAESAASSAARTEARLIYDALEANAALADGELVFHPDHGSVVAAALDATSLGQAIAALRNQRTPAGNVADLEAAHLVVASDLETTARKLVHEAGLQITVTASALLAAGRWYVMADPGVQPVVAVLRPTWARESFRLSAVKAPISFDGIAMRGTADLGAAIVSRVGIVRGGV